MQPEKFVEASPEQDRLIVAIARARFWEHLLNDPEARDEITMSVAEIVDDMDSYFPYMGQMGYMSGYGLHPLRDSETDKVIDEEWGVKLGEGGVHLGFTISENEAGECIEYKVHHHLLVAKTIEKIGQTIVQDQVVSSFYDLDSLFLPTSEVDAAFGIDQTDNHLEFYHRIERAMVYSKQLRRLYASTAFRRESHQNQIRQARELIAQAESHIKIRDIDILTQAEYAYIPVLNDSWTLVPMEIGGIDISGRCLGLESTESVKIKQKAIRRDRDMIDKLAGLCLVIDPDQETRERLRMEAEHLLYLPTGSQAFEIISAD